MNAKKIGLVGHSEGGIIAPIVASRSKDVAFIVLMAGTGVNGEELLRAQAAGIARAMGVGEAAIARNRGVQERMNAIVKQESDPKVREARMKELRETLGAPGKSAAMDGQFAAAISPWFRFFLMYDPAPALRKVTCPVLAINGERDLQVPQDQNLPAIERALKEGGNRDYSIVKLPKLNHLFQTSETGSPAEYLKIEETIAPLALETMSDWILKHAR